MNALNAMNPSFDDPRAGQHARAATRPRAAARVTPAALTLTLTLTFAVAVATLAAAANAGAAEIRVLSAGAIEPGLRPAIAAFERSGGHTVKLQFATAPAIRERLEKAGDPPVDIVIAPPAVLALLPADASRPVCAERVAIGRVGLGVAVRAGSTPPDISSSAAFTRSMLDADALVFNRASTGLYLEQLLKRLRIDAETAPKTTRYADGAAVMRHVAHAEGRVIGLGAITEIMLARGEGVQLVGALPGALQSSTEYVAMADCRAKPKAAVQAAVRALLRELAGSRAQAGFKTAGIEGPR